MRLSANTGFLYPGRPLSEAIRAAAAAGFDAVEFHDEPQRSDIGAVRAALDETGLPVVSMNIFMGPTAGCAASPGREAQFAEDLRHALRAADALDVPALHVLAGPGPGDRATFLRNLRRALGETDRRLLIEPICGAAAPDYALRLPAQAAEIIEDIGDDRLQLLFDCFHVQMETGDAQAQFDNHAGRIGHVQVASVPGRIEPTAGAAWIVDLMRHMAASGYRGAFGLEYRPSRSIAETVQGLRAAMRDPPSSRAAVPIART